jgi:hypothetical protein
MRYPIIDDMLIAGTVLQLVAGFLFGLTNILPKKRFDRANEELKRFLLFPSKGKRRLRILIFGAWITPLALVLIAAYVLEGRAVLADVRWFEALGGGFLGSLIAGMLYLSLLRRLAQLISKTKAPEALPDDTYFRTLLFGNLILVPVLGGFGWVAVWGGATLSMANIGNVPVVVVLVPTIVLLFLGPLLILSACIAGVFIVLAGVIKIVSLMARPRRILWIVVLLLYVLGGAFLIASACRA